MRALRVRGAAKAGKCTKSRKAECFLEDEGAYNDLRDRFLLACAWWWLMEAQPRD
jgi:hypothetical protein